MKIAKTILGMMIAVMMFICISATAQAHGRNTTGQKTSILKSFDARVKDGKVQLQWTAAASANTVYFDIQRSTDGEHFESIGQVSGKGKTAASYATEDKSAAGSKVYYRILNVSYDGSFSYASIIPVVEMKGMSFNK